MFLTHKDMTTKDLLHLVRLCRDMAAVIDKYQRVMKPREADKARQARKLIKKLQKEISNEEKEKPHSAQHLGNEV